MNSNEGLKAAYISYADFGGPRIHTEEFIRAFGELVPDLVTWCPYLDREVSPARDSGPSFFNRLFKHLPAFARQWKLEFFQLRKLRRDRRQEGFFRQLYRENGIEVVIIRNDAFVAGAISAALHEGIPYVLEMNGILSIDHPDRVARAFERSALRNAAGVTAVSDPMAEMILGLSPVARDILVVPNGVRPEAHESPDLSVVSPEVRSALEGKVVAGYTGTFTQNHDMDPMIRGFALAAARQPDLRLLLVGEGRRDPATHDLIEELDIGERVISTGMVPHDHVPACLALCDLMLNPLKQTYREAFVGIPVKMFEYMASRRPIISTDMAIIRELQEESALYVAEGDADGWRDAISTLAADPALRDEMGRKSLEQLLARGFTWESNARKVYGFCLEIIR